MLELLERESPLDSLRTALHEAVAGSGRVALVSGEAGIGKTSLVERFVAEQRASARVLWGACDSLFTPRPLGPLHDIAAQTQGDLLSQLNAEANRTALFSACLSELQRRPTIAVFEDIHWADEATLDLIKFLGRRIQHTPSLLVLTYRDDEVGPRHPLRLVLGDLATSSATRRVALSPLSEMAVRTLVGDQTLDPAALHRQTGGNPFFVTEVLASGSGGIPATVRDAVLARAARLSASAQAVLEAAAVIGPRIEPWLLSEVVRAEAGATDDCMAAGMLLAQGDAFAFRHELARQTILETLSPHRKIAMHRLVLDALKSSPRTRHDLAQLAHHAEAASEPEAVRAYAQAAAQQAAKANAHREAAAQYLRVLRFAEDRSPAERALLLEAYAWECNLIDRRADGIEARRQALELWREVGQPVKQGENLAHLALLLALSGQNAEAEQASRAAIDVLEALPPGRELALAHRAQASLRMLNQDCAEAIEWGEKAITLAQCFEDATVLALARNAVGSAWLFLDYERGCEYLERSIALARQAGMDAHVANAMTNLGSGSAELYQLQRADRYLAEGITYATERDFDAMRLSMLAWQAFTCLHLGRWNDAADITSAVLQRPGVSAYSRIIALAVMGRLRARRGDPGSIDVLDEALELAAQTGTLQRLGPVRTARAEAAWLGGDRGRTLHEARAAYDLAASKLHAWFTGELVFWRWRAGDDVSLPTWTAKPFAWQIAGDWRTAAAEWERLSCPYEQARALADGDESAQLAALDIFERLGARPAAEAVRQKLSALPARRLEKERFGGLTEREREVVALIARGKSNREIAHEMTVGVKTVETYVTRILNKLGFDSRVQIATWAVEKGLAPPSHASED
jgi:DNA-binding CsgD family transcriptional regulator